MTTTKFERDVTKTRLETQERPVMVATRKHAKPCPGCNLAVREGDRFMSIPRGNVPTTWHELCYGGDLRVTTADPDRLAAAQRRMARHERASDGLSPAEKAEEFARARRMR